MEGVMPRPELNPNLLICLYFFTKILPVAISGFAIYLGYQLFILGVTGHASLSIDTHDVKGQLINAAPGLFFAVGGIVALVIAIIKGLRIDFGGGGGSSAQGGELNLQNLRAGALRILQAASI